MSKPVIFTIVAAWDDEASVWSGHCDDIPAAADAPSLDELLAKISAMTLDLLPDDHPGVEPASVFLQLTALCEAEPAVADGAAVRQSAWRVAARCRVHVCPSGKRQSRDLAQSDHKTEFAVPIGIPSRHTANAILRQAGLPKAF
jgi:hypothetical protein